MSLLGPKRRVWNSVGVMPVAGGFGVVLDDRLLHTPARQPLCVPARAVAEAIAAEWAAQKDEIVPDTLPLTRLANTAQDRVALAMAAVIDEVAGYGSTDLLCYRAPSPAALVERQAAAWDAPLAWARSRHGASLLLGEGVMHVAQPVESLAKLRSGVEAIAGSQGPLGLVALAELVALSGSLVLGLAVAEGALDAGSAWHASRIDEAWQAEQWGEDAEALLSEARKAADFSRAAWLSGALRGA